MASFFYNRFKADLLQGDIDLDTGADVVKVQLHTSSYTPDKDHNVVGDLSNELANGNGYATGGATLANQVVVEDDTNDLASSDADDTTWTTLTGTFRYAILVDVTNTNSLICCIDFESNVSRTATDLTLRWNSSGILTVTDV